MATTRWSGVLPSPTAQDDSMYFGRETVHDRPRLGHSCKVFAAADRGRRTCRRVPACAETGTAK